MVSSENGGVSGQVIKVVHDDSHEQVEHQERTEIEQEWNVTQLIRKGSNFFCSTLLLPPWI